MLPGRSACSDPSPLEEIAEAFSSPRFPTKFVTGPPMGPPDWSRVPVRVAGGIGAAGRLWLQGDWPHGWGCGAAGGPGERRGETGCCECREWGKVARV